MLMEGKANHILREVCRAQNHSQCRTPSIPLAFPVGASGGEGKAGGVDRTPWLPPCGGSWPRPSTRAQLLGVQLGSWALLMRVKSESAKAL